MERKQADRKKGSARNQTMVRIHLEDKAVLDKIAEDRNESLPLILHRAIELLEHHFTINCGVCKDCR